MQPFQKNEGKFCQVTWRNFYKMKEGFNVNFFAKQVTTKLTKKLMCVSCICICFYTGLYELGGKGRHSDWAVDISHLGLLECGGVVSEQVGKAAFTVQHWSEICREVLFLCDGGITNSYNKKEQTLDILNFYIMMQCISSFPETFSLFLSEFKRVRGFCLTIQFSLFLL